jgi:hypothetical protein
MPSEPAAKVDVAPTPPPPAEAKPSAEQTKTVEAFEGEWTYEATITPPGGKPIKAPIGMSCKRIALGKAAACAISETIAGMGPFEGGFLVGFDPFDKTMHFMAVRPTTRFTTTAGNGRTRPTSCEPLKAGLAVSPPPKS